MKRFQKLKYAIDKKERTPLNIAIENKRCNLAVILCKHGAKIEKELKSETGQKGIQEQ